MKISSETSSANKGFLPFYLFEHKSRIIEAGFSSTISTQSLGSSCHSTNMNSVVPLDNQDTRYQYRSNTYRTTIDYVPGESFEVIRPIPVLVQRISENEYLASFTEANIGMSGETQQEALQNLLVDILDAFDLFLSEESNLGPEPIRELAVLRQYLKAT